TPTWGAEAAVLELENVTISYGRTPAVTDLSLSVAPGEAVSLVGPNGAGKTTTLSAIIGMRRITAGTVRFEGEAITGTPPEVLVRRGMALVPEGRQIFATLTVRENLRLATADLSRAAAGDALDRELERFPVLRDRLEHPAGGLSGGQQQQLAIARALLCRPRLLLLDEPSLGLAPKIVDDVFATLQSLREDGVTILLVEQNAMRAVRFADRAYVLVAGRIVLQGTGAELADTERLTDSYLGVAR
ncbi:MAG: high affinity branched chain amino acid transporter, binding component, partial [Conexibacter sp.]|nr:high affinity branched chain amino acid transporter, binding component [Conexibacter sp.]